MNPVLVRSIGYIASLILTLLAYFVVVLPEMVGLSHSYAAFVIIFFAVIQAAVQVIFFLDVWQEKGTRWNLGVFISTVGLVLLIILFSIWIMHALNAKMQM